jgi:hypothetical protein
LRREWKCRGTSGVPHPDHRCSFARTHPTRPCVSRPTDRVNKIIPEMDTSGLRHLPPKGEGGIMVPGPLVKEVPVGRDYVGLSS